MPRPKGITMTVSAVPSRDRQSEGIRRPTHNLHRLRVAQGLTRAALAFRIGTEASTIRRYELDREPITEDHQARLSEVFGATICHLMGRD